MRVSLIEADNIMDSIRPCHSLSEAQRIRNIQFERDFQFRYWLRNNTWDVKIGFLLFMSAALVAVFAYCVHLRDERRRRREEETPITYPGLGDLRKY
ncbi:hypothetical protein M3Y99_00094200 [Aphelenchoides fujianensis]|nr:hypothetical protein M3Y99_00094200 [Aphelenchoides fujianensis]